MNQNLIDKLPQGRIRRGTSSIHEYVITENGASESVAKGLSANLLGKLTGNAIRVPTPNGLWRF